MPDNDDTEEGTEPAPSHKDLLLEVLLTFLHGNPGKVPEPSARFPLNSVASLLKGFHYPGPDENVVVFNVPSAVHHSLFLATFFGRLVTSFPEARLTGVLVGASPRQHTPTTHLLAQLCYQVLAGFEHPYTAEIIQPDLDCDLRSALQGHNPDFIQTVLWAALKSLLATEDLKQQHMIVLGFTGPDSLTPEVLSVVRRLPEFMNSTERRQKLLVVHPHYKSEDIMGAHLNEAFLGTEEVRSAVLADFDSWIDLLVNSRTALRDMKPQILSTVTRCYEAHQDPQLLIAYLSTLYDRAGLSRSQLDVDSVLLLSPEPSKWLEFIMASIFVHRPCSAAYASTILSLVRVSERPLSTKELATAFAVVHSAPDFVGIDDDIPLDIEYDLHTCLAGLVSEEGGYLRPSHPILVQSLSGGKPDRGSTSTIPSVSAGAHTDMAICCLKYMLYWKRSNPDAKIDDNNTSTLDGPFLDYAVSFWLWHYAQGVSQGSANPDINPLLEDWDLVRFWMTMWSRKHYLAMGETVSTRNDESLLRPTLISTTFNVDFAECFNIALVAAQILPIADDDEEMAVLWALWCSEEDSKDDDGRNARRDLWKDKLTSHSRLPILLKLFPHAPLQTFRLLDTNPEFVADYTNVLLPTAIRQGILSIVSACFDHQNMNDDLILKLPWVSCARNGNTALLQKLSLRWPREASIEWDELGSVLLCEAARYGNLEVVDMILGWEFELGDFYGDSMDAVLLGAEGGFAKILQHIKEKYPDIFTRNGGNAKALYAACKMGFLEVTKVLTTDFQPAPIVSLNEDGDTPLHVAVSNGHVDVLRLLLDQVPPPLVDLGYLLLNAANHGHSEVVRDLLRREGIDYNAVSEPSKSTALNLASACGHVDIVKDLIAHKVHLWAADCDGDTALDTAVQGGNDNVVRVLLAESPSQEHLNRAIEGGVAHNPAIMTQLLNAGADIHHPRHYERTLLHSAAYSDSREALGILLMRRANLDAKDESGDTPLADACSQGFVEVARMLVDAGASLTTTNFSDLTPFQQAALEGHEAVVRLLLEKDSRPSIHLSDGRSLVECLIDLEHTGTIAAILDLANPDLFTAALLSRYAYCALRADDTATLKLLLRKDGVDLDAESAKAGFATALQECAYHGNLKMAKVLIAHQPGVDVNKEQGWYHTAIIASACRQENPGDTQYRRRRKMIYFLISEGADLPVRGGLYGTMLNAAAACASARILAFLMDDDDNVNLPPRWIDEEGRGAVHMACVSSCETKEKLAELRKIDTNTALLRRTDKQGRALLHFACGHGNLAAIRSFSKSKLRLKAYVDAKDGDGWRPLHWACRQWNAEVVRFLVHELGADTTATTSDGWTPSDVAMFHGHEGFAEAMAVEGPEPKAAGEGKVEEIKRESGEGKGEESGGELVAGEEVSGAGEENPNEELLAGGGKSGGGGDEGDIVRGEKIGTGDEMDLCEATPEKLPVPTEPGVKHDETCFSCLVVRAHLSRISSSSSENIVSVLTCFASNRTLSATYGPATPAETSTSVSSARDIWGMR